MKMFVVSYEPTTYDPGDGSWHTLSRYQRLTRPQFLDDLTELEQLRVEAVEVSADVHFLRVTLVDQDEHQLKALIVADGSGAAILGKAVQLRISGARLLADIQILSELCDAEVLSRIITVPEED